MSKKSRRKTRKQKVIHMVGCYKKHKHNKSCKKYHGGSSSGCGSCGCPVGGLTYNDMSKYGGRRGLRGGKDLRGGKGGYSKVFETPVLIEPPNNKGFNGILGIGQRGGNCGCQKQMGGSFYKPAGPMPGPFVGSPWEATKWPTQDGISGDRNYLPQVNVVDNPQQQMRMDNSGYNTMNSKVGGTNRKSRKSRRRKMRGGFLKQELVNLGRDVAFNFKSAYNGLTGVPPPVSEQPYKDQLVHFERKM